MSEAETAPNMPNKCPQCGATLPAGALEGLCPACLLKQGAETGPAPDPMPFQPPSVEEVARLFPQLQILAFIGKGGMGAVYQARQPALDRLVALKILPPQAAGGPGFAERFNREARALARLNHPNIVAVHEFGQINGLPYFIMEFVDGLNLRQLEQTGKLSPREALLIVPQICEALQFAHDEGIVHRDIKPENILLDKRGRVKIADFGIAKILGSEQEISLTETKGAIGTPHYMAPEQMENPTSVDHRADIFSLGVVFYEMLTGELPLGKFSPPSSRKVEVDVRLDDVVLRTLEKDPERRYQHASQVKTAVDTIATSVPPPIASAAVLAREILASDYQLNIRSCFRRAWALVRSDFWPIIGVSALLIALYVFASSFGGSFMAGTHEHEDVTGSSVLAMLVYGPLFGGLSLFYLKKIRGEPTTVETAFVGFSNRFLHLFLAGFVCWVLTAVGFVCLILPGIYLVVAWWFALTLVVDKQIDFWSAMELSRRVVTRHWWKFFAFFLLVLLMYAVGLVFLLIGFLLTAPIAMIAATYAYEDIFGAVRAPSTAAASAGTGPTGTIVMPGVPPKQPPAPSEPWRPQNPGYAAAAIGLGLAVILLFVVISHHRSRLRAESEQNLASQAAEATRNFNYDALVQRMKSELKPFDIRFSDMQLSENDDHSLVVSFSGLKEKALVNETNAVLDIAGTVVGERDENNVWNFQGQNDLRNVNFTIPELDSPALLRQSLAHTHAAGNEANKSSRETLQDRLEAASAINDFSAKSEALAAVAKDAATAGEMGIIEASLRQIMDFNVRDETAHQSALLLAKGGMRKQALQIAKSIQNRDVRDKALSDLAQ